MASVTRILFAAALVATTLLFLVSSPALAASCWDGATEEQEIGFDFLVLGEVQGPDDRGIYTYSYALYRVDQGGITYRSPSHVSILFGCEGEAASGLILGGVSGISLGGASSAVCSTEVAMDASGFNEPGLGDSCPTNGFKLEFCDEVPAPDGDGSSFPDDPNDPVLTISFRSLASPVEGAWFLQGGRNLVGSVVPGSEKPPVTFLTDGGKLLVPSCLPPLPAESASWGRVKQMYR